MTALNLIACIGMITGTFLLLGISPLEFTNGMFGFLIRKDMSIRAEIKESTNRKKMRFLRREIMEVQDILKLTGRENGCSMVCAVSLMFFAAGAAVAILLENVFLIPVLAAGLMMLPFWYIRLTASHYKRAVAAELETALSIITTSYLRNEDILTAVEESVQYLNPPVRGVFIEFLSQTQLIDPAVEAALHAMKPKIQNEVFHEWTDAICACRYDRSLKTTLTPIVSKLSDMRIVNAELEYLVSEPRKEFIIMAMLVVGNIPILYMLNRDWYHTLMDTMVGHIILAVCAAAIFISMSFVIKLTKPIEYRR